METLVMHAKCLNNPFDPFAKYFNKMTKKKKSVCVCCEISQSFAYSLTDLVNLIPISITCIIN